MGIQSRFKLSMRSRSQRGGQIYFLLTMVSHPIHKGVRGKLNYGLVEIGGFGLPTGAA